MITAIETCSSFAESCVKIHEIQEIVVSGRNTTVLERIDIATRFCSIFCSISSCALNGISLFVTGTNFSEVCEKWGPLLTKISRVANIIQNTTTIAVCQERRNTTSLGEYVQLIAPGMRAMLSFVPGEVYSSISQTLRGNEAESWWNKPSTVVGFSELIQHSDILVGLIQRIGSILTPVTQDPSSAHQTPLQSLLNRIHTPHKTLHVEKIWGQMARLWSQKVISPSDLKDMITFSYLQEGGEEFLCTLSHNIILCPLKHTESGALFEKTVVEQKFRENTSLPFSKAGRVFQITRAELVSSPEDQIRIAQTLGICMNDVCCECEDQSLFSQQTYQTRQTDAVAIEQLRCQWNLVVFVELKAKVLKNITGFFEKMNDALQSNSYWWTDPRRGLIALAQSELARAEEEQKKRFEQPTNPEELRKALSEAQQSIAPGFLSWFLFGEFNLLTNFEPIISVKVKIHGEIPECIKQMISTDFPEPSTSTPNRDL